MSNNVLFILTFRFSLYNTPTLSRAGERRNSTTLQQVPAPFFENKSSIQELQKNERGSAPLSIDNWYLSKYLKKIRQALSFLYVNYILPFSLHLSESC